MAPNKNNIQGHIWPGLPKNAEKYYFFKIPDGSEDDFRQTLKSLVDDNQITSAAEALEERSKISEHKQNGGTDAIEVVGVNIAFCPRGLQKIGKTGSIDSDEFNWGMYKERSACGSDDLSRWMQEFQNPGDPWAQHPPDERIYDGVLIVSGDSEETVDDKIGDLEEAFGSSMENKFQIDGKVRPGDKRGREHFGFKDSISQPALEGLDSRPAENAPKMVPPHCIFVDPSMDSAKYPQWTADGSFLAFRKLQQLAPEFDHFLTQNGNRYFPYLYQNEAAELLGARLIGRWKNGAPVDITPERDDPHLPADRLNAFNYAAEPPVRCPFAAHIRNMQPRIDDNTNGKHAILRRGIAYGDEVTDAEHSSHKTDSDRGILFVGYQSNLFNGFRTLQSRRANDAHFPSRKQKMTGAGGPGLDPIIGQPRKGADRYDMSLADGQSYTHRLPLEQWVIPQGGDYFFSPSLTELSNVA